MTKSIDAVDRSSTAAQTDCSTVDSEIAPVRGLRRLAYWVLAFFFFALAMVGVVLPGIPTTPFLLLMSYFLLRVSPALHAKAMGWPLVGGPLRDWRDEGGVRLSVKILACSMVTVLVGSTLLWSNLAESVKLIILCVAVYGVSVVIRLPRATAARSGTHS